MSIVDAVRPDALPEPGGADSRLLPARPSRSGHIRVYADAAGAAEVMRELIGIRLYDALLGEEDGHWYVDVPDGDGVLRRIVDLVADATELGTVGYAMLCVDGRTFTFAPGSRGTATAPR